MIKVSSKLAEKMWKTTTEKGIGNLFKPWQMRREGAASLELERNRLLVMAQTEMDVENIKNGKVTLSLSDVSNPKLSPSVDRRSHALENTLEPYLDMEMLERKISKNLARQEIEKEINISKALLIADEELSSDNSEPSSSTIEPDWLFRWRDYVSSTYSNDLQTLWGKLLAGEIKTPGTYSLRTLEFLKNLSQKEALEIQEVFRYTFGNLILRKPETPEGYGSESLNKALQYNHLFNLESLGILYGVSSIGLSSTMKSEEQGKFKTYIYFDNKTLFINSDNPSQTLTLESIFLSPLGIELKSLCKTSIDSGYLDFVIKTIKDRGFKVFIGDRTQLDCGMYNNTNIREV